MMPFIYVGPEADRAAWEAARTACDTQDVNRITVTAPALAAIAANDIDRTQDAAVQAQAQAIIDNPATTLTQAQIIGAIKQLAQGISVLATHDDLTKRELTGLARLVCDALDTTDGT